MGAIPADENYRGSADPEFSCASCAFFVKAAGNHCLMFDTPVDPNAVCDDWQAQRADVEKSTAHAAQLHLQVVGVHKAPDGRHVYRLQTRDGFYVGRTTPSTTKAAKGDVLRVVASDFRINAGGDYEWQNPNVHSIEQNRADTQKVLMQIAAGVMPMEKDTSTVGDPPASQDTTFGSGPTLGSVHVNAPLANISLSYATRRIKGNDSYVVKAFNPHRQLVYGVVLEPNTLDSQEDFMLPGEVEKTAHGYLKKALRGRSSVTRLQHTKRAFFRDKASVVPVESFVAPVDFTYDGKEMIKKGSWVLVVHVEDPSEWERVLAGEYTGFSIGGTGVRRSVHRPAF